MLVYTCNNIQTQLLERIRFQTELSVSTIELYITKIMMMI